MDRRRLGGIIHRGGTVLGTERSAEFATPEGQRSAAGKLAEAEVEGLVVIGGNGSLTGGLIFFRSDRRYAGGRFARTRFCRARSAGG
jgi:6-phosphofructokinase 1